MADAPLVENPLFEIRDLHVSTPGSDLEPGIEILKGVSLTVNAGEVHALIGATGSGKSTLAAALLGSSHVQITSGSVHLNGDDITDWDPDVRAKAGLFLAFEDPQEITGVSILSFLHQAIGASKGGETSVQELQLSLTRWMEKLGIDPSFIHRYVNEGFSAEEKKQCEILQLAVLEPRMAVLDEPTPGLSSDAQHDRNTLEVIAQGFRAVKAEQPRLGTLTITHQQRLLEHLKPDCVHVLVDGRITTTGALGHDGETETMRLDANGHESFA